jgi:hypothetical protein
MAAAAAVHLQTRLMQIEAEAMTAVRSCTSTVATYCAAVIASCAKLQQRDQLKAAFVRWRADAPTRNAGFIDKFSIHNSSRVPPHGQKPDVQRC